jgi:hypothetical protein
MRITGSTASKVPKKEATDPKKFLNSHLYSKFSGNSATEHGSMCEGAARKAYQNLCEQVDIMKKIRGFVLVLMALWGLTKLLIKTPFNKDVPSFLASGKYDVSTATGTPVLLPNGKNGYSSQVQIMMECAGRSTCDLLVWVVTITYSLLPK